MDQDPGERIELTNIVELMIILGAGLGIIAMTLLTGPLGAGPAEAIGTAIIALFAIALIVILVRVTANVRGGARGWRRACARAGLRPVEPRWASVLRIGLPSFEGTIDGRAARAVHVGHDPGSVVWLFVKGEPRPGWQRSEDFRDVVRFDHRAPWMGVALRPADVSAREVHRLLCALASHAQ